MDGQIANRFARALMAAWRAIRLPAILRGLLFLGLIHNRGQALGVTLPATNSVALAWDGSTSSGVTSYRVYYGGARGNYTNSVTVGNVTTGTVAGLASGSTYYLTVVARAASGLESDHSNEISYTVPGASTVRVGLGSNRQVTLTLTGQSGRTYGIEATQDFKTWTVINTVTVGTSGSVSFTDVNAVSFQKRFYRTRE